MRLKHGTLVVVGLIVCATPYALALTYFANAIGGARSGNLPRARSALHELQVIHDTLVANRPSGPYDWAGQVEAMRLAAAGWVSFAAGDRDDAVRLLSESVELEKTVGKHPVTPGALVPAAELLGDRLIEVDRPKDALAAYEASLAVAPRRSNALAGAARAAASAGDRATAERYDSELRSISRPTRVRGER